MLLRAVLLLTLAAFVDSSPAFAYPLNDGTGGVVWGFEGTASDFSGGAHTVSGSLRLDPASNGDVHVGLTAVLDGTDALTGGVFISFRNSAPGAGPDQIYEGAVLGNGYVVPPAYAIHPTSDYWFPYFAWAPILVDVDGVAFDNGLMPPPYAPDIALFELHALSIGQSSCHDLYPGSYCAQGQGQYGVSETLHITIDRFVDPVPEPASLGLVVLALAVTTLSRRRRVSDPS